MPEVTENYVRIPFNSSHRRHKVRTITVSNKEGIRALYCVDHKLIVTYLFSKSKGWTMEKAREWVRNHKQ